MPFVARLGRQIKRSQFCRTIFLLLAGFIAAQLTELSAQAASQTWTGGSVANGNWSSALNWLGGAAPGATSGTTNTDIATFDAAISNSWGNAVGNPIVVDANRNIFGISFTGAAGNYFVGSTGGNALKLSSGGSIEISNTLTATNAIETINAPLVIQGASGIYTFANNSASFSGAGVGTLNFGGGITGSAAGATVLTLSGSNVNANTISGIIANGTATTLAVTKTGSGTWILSNANTYTGATIVNGGTLTLSFGTVTTNILSSSSALTLGGGTLQLTGTGTQTVNGLSTTASTGSRIVLGANQTLTLGGLTSAGTNSALNFNTAVGGANASASTVGTGIIVLTGQTVGNAINSSFTLTDLGFGLATVNGSNQVIRLTTTLLLPASGAGSSTTDYRINNNNGGTSAAGSRTLTVSASATANSITVDTTNSPGLLTLNAGVVLSNNTWNFGSGAFSSSRYEIIGSVSGAGLRSVASGNAINFNNYNSVPIEIGSPIMAIGSNVVSVFGTGTLVFAGINTYTGGTIVSGGTLEVASGGSITHNSSDTIVGDNSGGNATFNITGGTVSNLSGVIGNFSGSRGTVTVSSGNWTNTSDLSVGLYGTGVLNVTGGTVSSVVGNIGTYSGSSGTVTVSSGSWTNSSHLYVGLYGVTGVLNITGGTVSSDAGYIGTYSGSSGVVTVSSGSWTNSGSLTVGLLGTGVLNVTGGTVSSLVGIIGSGPSSNGTVTVSSGSWNINFGLLFGQAGTGVLNLTGVGTVSVGSGGTGIVTLASNSGSSGTLNLGTGGAAGTLNAATVTGGDGTAVVNFNHTGSYMFAPQLTGSLAVNKLGVGTTILTAANTYTGGTIVRSGTLQVAMGGSFTHTSANLIVGNISGDTGTLNIIGGSVSSAQAILGFNSGSSGTVTASSGSWSNSSLFVGVSGTGVLNVSGGIVSNSGDGFIAYNSGSSGTVTVSSGSWSNGSLSVGFFGTGVLNLTGVGAVSVGSGGTGTLTLAFSVGSSGTLNLGTGGAAGTLNATTVIGGSGTAVVNFNHTGSYTFAPQLAGSLSVNKLGTGTTILIAANTYTGLTTVNGGTLELAFGTVSTNILSSSSALRLGGGTLQLTGTGTQTVNGLSTANSTGSKIVMGANQTLTLGALTSAGATSSLNLNTAVGGANGATVGTGIIVLTGQTAGNAINSSFTVTDAGGFGLATVNASNQVIRLTTTTLLPAAGIGSSTSDYRIDNNAGGTAAAGSRTLTISASKSAKSITVDTTAANGVLTLNSGVVLSNNTWNFGGTGTNTYQVTGSAGGAGLKTVSPDIGIYFNNYASNTITISTRILANGSNRVSVFGTGTLIFTGANTYTGDTNVRGGTLQVASGGSITHTSSDTFVGDKSGENGTLNIAGGTVTNRFGYIGFNSGSSGTVTVSSGNWTNSSDLYVGNLGTGVLNVTGGSVSNLDGYIGFDISSSGMVTVSSGNWTNNNLSIGFFGTGALNVAGGTLASSSGTLGAASGSSGTATVSGGSWTNNGGDFYVGDNGTGVLNVTGGTVSNSGNGYIGLNSGSSGTVTVSSGIWSNSSDLCVGLSGTGVLAISGGNVSNHTGYIGLNSGSSGMATVSSGNWTNNSGFYVGHSGTGVLNVTGGSASSNSGLIGYNSGSSGTATVSGGIWTNISTLYVGYSGTGVLNVTGVGTVNIGSGGTGPVILAFISGSSGTVNLGTGGVAGTLSAASVNGGSGTAVVNFNHTGGYAFVPQLAGNLVVNKLGSGTTVLYGSNSYTGPTTITVGQLIAANANALNPTTGGAVTVAAGAGLSYAAVANAPLGLHTTLTITGGAGTVIGGSIGSTATSAQINVTGAATRTNAALAVNIYGISGVTPLPGTNIYTLLQGGAGSSLNPSTAPVLGMVYNNSNFTVGTLSTTTTTFQVAITSATAITTAYWVGGLSGAANVWAASNGSTASNWATTPTGAVQALVPGSGTSVIISAKSPSTAPTATVLGANMSISRLTIADIVNGLGLNGDGFTLTIGSGGIAMNASVPASTIAANVNLGSSQIWTNNSASALTVSGIISGGAGSSLTKEGTGTLTLSAANSYTGTTIVNGGTLELAFGTVSTNILSSSSALRLGGGTLLLTGTGTQTFNGLSTAGTTGSGSKIVMGANQTLILGGLTSAGANSSLNFNTAVGGAIVITTVGTGIIVLTGQTVGIAINSGFTVTDAGGFGLATVNSSDQVVRLATTSLLPATGATSTTDYRIDNNAGSASTAGSRTLTVSASESAKSITVDTSAANGVLTLNSTRVLSNSTWNFGGTGSNTYQVTGSASGAGLKSVSLDNPINFNNYASGTITISSPILANGVNRVSVFGTGTLVFAGANTYTGDTVVRGGTLEVASGGSITHTSSGTIVGNLSGDNGTLNITGGSISNFRGTLGNASGSKGTATVNSGSWTNSSDLYVGNSGTGVLNVNGGTVSNTIGNVGTNPSSSGTVTVSSGNWTNSNILYVGNAGTGVLHVTGGSVSSLVGYIGTVSGSSGTVTISGGNWTNSGDLYVGNAGTGVLNVTGGSVANVRGLIGNNSGSGTVTVSSGSWSNSGNLLVGYSGTGVLNVSGGTVSNTFADVGVSSSGTVTVTSGNWNSGGSIAIGNSDTGVLNVTGGTVSNTVGYIGLYSGSSGTVTVSSGSWNNSGNLIVGNDGTGVLNVTGVGTVSVGSGGTGTVTLAAFTSGSSGTLNLGTGGMAGTLNAAIVTSGSGTAVVNFNHTGSYTFAPQLAGSLSVNKLGAGTTILTAANTYVGGTFISGGTLQANNTIDSATGTGGITVNGTGTLAGTGTVSGSILVQSGATLSAGNQLTISAPGTLTVNGTTPTVTLAAGSKFGFYQNTSLTPIAAVSLSGGSGTAGTINNLLTVNGTFAVADPTNLTILLNGDAGTFTLDQSYSFRVVTATNAISTFNITNQSQFDTTSFANFTGQFQFSLISSGTAVYLEMTPTPEPGAILAICAPVLVLGFWIRRRARGTGSVAVPV